MKTTVHYSDVLSISDGRLVSFDRMEGVYRIADALAGPGCTTLSLVYLAKPLAEVLKARCPVLAEPRIKEALDRALDEFRQLPERSQDDLKRLMNQHVLPLLPGEYFEVEHLGEEAVDKLQEGYGPFLDELLKDKPVIAVVVG